LAGGIVTAGRGCKAGDPAADFWNSVKEMGATIAKKDHGVGKYAEQIPDFHLRAAAGKRDL
jgi:hypothetical protein